MRDRMRRGGGRIALGVLLVGFLSVGFLTSSSRASEVTLVWTGTTGAGSVGASSIAVSTSVVETLTLDMILDVDSNGICCAMFSLDFDTDLKDELDVLSSEKLADLGNMFVLHPRLRSSQESSESQTGQLYGFEGVAITGDGPVNTTLVFARVVFQTKPANVMIDGADVEVGEKSPGGTGNDDGAFENSPVGVPPKVEATMTYGTAAVNPSTTIPAVPRIGLVLLFGAGLVVAARALRRG